MTLTGESTFTEDGTITVDGGALAVSTVGTGAIRPTPEEGTMNGAVVWEVAGSGGLSGVTGLATANFEFQPAQGTSYEYQVLRLFLP